MAYKAVPGLSPADNREQRLAWLKALRKGAGLLREEAPAGLPFDLFDVAGWSELQDLVQSAIHLSSRSPAINAVCYALNYLPGPLVEGLTARREAASQLLDVSTRTVRRLEEQGLSEVNDWVGKLRDPETISEEFDRAVHVLRQVKASRRISEHSKGMLEKALSSLEEVSVTYFTKIEPSEDEKRQLFDMGYVVVTSTND